MNCPHCGRQLFPVALGPDSAPWVCPFCHRAYWVAELETGAYRREYRDFGFGKQAKELEERCLQEREEARARGTSVRPDQLHLLPSFLLAHLPESLREGVELELARRDQASPISAS